MLTARFHKMDDWLKYSDKRSDFTPLARIDCQNCYRVGFNTVFGSPIGQNSGWLCPRSLAAGRLSV